jgi:hypothetical protein
MCVGIYSYVKKRDFFSTAHEFYSKGEYKNETASKDNVEFDRFQFLFNLDGPAGAGKVAWY